LELELLSKGGDQIVSELSRVISGLWNSIKHEIGTWVCALNKLNPFANSGNVILKFKDGTL